MAVEDKRICQIALTLIPGIGNIMGKKLVSICGSAEAVFEEPKRIIRHIPRLGELLADGISSKEILSRAECEVRFIERFGIQTYWFQDKGYPYRLLQCFDAPLLLFYKGIADVNARRTVGIVGTRRATGYGRSRTFDLVNGLKQNDVVIVSGLAEGIDSYAHRFSLESGQNTIGVLGHGLDIIYPRANRNLAEQMVMQGGLITEFMSATKPDRSNFPKRNRIIAGMCDALVVVEAGSKGGALITADIANSYDRDVFAIPGRITDAMSEGVNHLIKTNRAALIQSAVDIEYLMGWRVGESAKAPHQKKIYLELSHEEEAIVQLLQEKGQLGIDDLCYECDQPLTAVSAALLNLEFEGVVRCLPGKIFRLT